MQAFIRTRVIIIDVLPDNPDPFISMELEKVILNDDGTVAQVIGNFDRIVKRLSNVKGVPVADIAVDGEVSAAELMGLIATHTARWVIERYGGTPKAGGGVWVNS